MLEKIASIILLRKAMSYSTSLVESLLVGMALVFILGLIASMLITSLIAGGIYISYHALIAHGTTPLVAAYIIGSALLLLLACVAIIAMIFIFRIRAIPKQLTTSESKLNKRMDEVIDAFIDGFDAVPLKR